MSLSVQMILVQLGNPLSVLLIYNDHKDSMHYLLDLLLVSRVDRVTILEVVY